MLLRKAIPISAGCLVLVGTYWAQTKPTTQQAAREILENNCLICHGTARMSGLDLRTKETILKGGKRGPAVVPGKAEESLLYLAVTHKGELKMPLGKEPLPSGDVEILRAWINEGARWDEPVVKTGEPSWWAFRKPRRPPVPSVKAAAWVHNPIDAFILGKLEEKGLKPAPPADKRTLVRRAYFDLLGLPPGPAEVKDFVKDSSPTAYEKLIDRLLASPRYGEKWGRHWLDVVRYADTGGFSNDVYFPDAWRYRDYVIKSLNDDKPYDRFVQEQIAGDELWPDTLELEGTAEIPAQKLEHLEARIGTGLYTIGPIGDQTVFNGDVRRHEWLADTADTTGAAFLGLTVGCAQCHDHKFDPIPQRDYYRLQALFAGSEVKEIPVVSPKAFYLFNSGLLRVRAIDEFKGELLRLDDLVRKRIKKEEKAKFPRQVVEAYEVSEDKRTPKQLELADQLDNAIEARMDKDGDLQPVPKKQEYTVAEWEKRQGLLQKIGEGYLKVQARYPTAAVLGHSDLVPEVHIALRGDPKQPGEKVGPGFLSVLSDGKDLSEAAGRSLVPQRRTALALWLTQPDHPLTARVMVNRLWQGHFGRGIVGTPNDFGRQGELPTHPELLDWLAMEFVERSWSLKSMHRLMMLSNTYQMSDQFDENNVRIDADNRYFWRMNRRRMEAEDLRDSVLAVAGKLNLKMGGPAVVLPLSQEELANLGGGDYAFKWPPTHDPEEMNRRSVYLYVKRSFPLPMFATFDMPSSSLSCPRRDVTTVAPQALALLNSSFMLTQAEQFATRLVKEQGQTPDAWIEAGFQLALGRTPSQREKQKFLEFLSQNEAGEKKSAGQPSQNVGGDPSPALVKLCLVLFNLNEFVYID